MEHPSGSVFMPGYVNSHGRGPRRITGGILYDGKVGQRFQSQGWKVDYFDLESLPRYAKFLKFPAADILDSLSTEFDVLISDLGNSAVMAGFQERCRHHGKLTVMICHHFRGELEKSLARRIMYRLSEKRSVESADLLVANSPHTADVLESLGRSSADIVLAPPGLQVPLAESPVLRRNPLEILSVCSMEPRKGVLEMVRAVHAAGNNGLRLTIAGEVNGSSEYYRRVSRLIEELGMASRVRIIGRQDDAELLNLYRRSDVFLLLSSWEGYGMAIAEAMAQGLPVISTKAGAIPDLVEDGVSGLLVEPGDWKGAAGLLRDVCERMDLREGLSAEALSAARAFPTWEETTGRIYNTVTEILSSR